MPKQFAKRKVEASCRLVSIRRRRWETDYRSICSDLEFQAEIYGKREETSPHRLFRDRNSGELRDLGVR